MPSLPLEISQSKSASAQASECHDGTSEITEQGKMLAEGLKKATVIQIGQRWPRRKVVLSCIHCVQEGSYFVVSINNHFFKSICNLQSSSSPAYDAKPNWHQSNSFGLILLRKLVRCEKIPKPCKIRKVKT